MDRYAEHFLDSAPYNAAKHGMAVMSGNSAFELGVNSELAPFLSQSGPAIEYLVVKKDSDGMPRWAEETKWIDIPWTIRLIGMARDLIEALWQLGAARMGGEDLGKIKLFDVPGYDDLMRLGKEKIDEEGASLADFIETDRMTATLIYFER
jgi:hypothetical protein